LGKKIFLACGFCRFLILCLFFRFFSRFACQPSAIVHRPAQAALRKLPSSIALRKLPRASCPAPAIMTKPWQKKERESAKRQRKKARKGRRRKCEKASEKRVQIKGRALFAKRAGRIHEKRPILKTRHL
jgi:hypothetical protein